MSGDNPPVRLEEPAPAKVNLYLHVVGRRADGYHLLDSLIVFASVGDRLAAERADGLDLALEGPFARALGAAARAADDNLILKAARRLARLCGVSEGARLWLVKNLPVAAGIGGGSADAAAALRLLCRLWRLDPPKEALHALALELGADVPVCLAGRPSYVGGIGEVLAPAPALPKAHLLLVNPLRPLATAAVFEARTGAFSKPARLAEAPRDARALAQALAARNNDLEAPARSLLPEVGAALAAIAGRPGALISRMSGSGATCFGLFADRASAEAAARAIAAAHPGWWTRAAALAGLSEA